MAPLLAFILLATGACAAPFRWEDVRTVYAFGDSYTFVQGTRGHANFSFIGDANNLAFTPRELLTNEVILKNTSSDGANWIEYLTGCFAGQPQHCNRALWDFAFAGADIDDALLPRHHDYTVSLTNQVSQFLTYARGILPRADLVAWWIGINDTGDTINHADIDDFDAFWESEMDAYFNAVQRVQNSGRARAHLFINVPPGERSPNTLGNATRAAIHASRIAGFNAALARRVAQFQRKHTGTTSVMFFDAHAWFNWALDHAAELGFTNITGFCHCKETESFFWYDAGHPTAAVHRLLAREIAERLRAA
ncbi:hypothetical protein AURDEDRAFT_164505 [Auricularia subglabra TFB-10046 SS5]|nr:hypothetical protein AURDEDRAFT_164505 [Auricularia subglabra TFB-10046 SS5]